MTTNGNGTKPMTEDEKREEAEKRIQNLLDTPIETDEDYRRLGEMFKEDE